MNLLWSIMDKNKNFRPWYLIYFEINTSYIIQVRDSETLLTSG